jgi:hypothetical protein
MLKNILGYIHGEVCMLFTGIEICENDNKRIQTDKISQQQENCENRNDPDLVQACLKKWWVESDFKAPKLPLSLQLKGSGYHYISIYNNTGTK